MSSLLVRFSSLGDIALTAAVTGSLDHVVYVTHQRYTELAKRLPGVCEVIGLEEGESIRSLAARVPPVEQVIDLHGSARSRALCVHLGLPTRRVDGAGVSRRMRVALKSPRQIRPVVERYCAAAGVPLTSKPWISVSGTEEPVALGLIPGAAHATKKWPLSRWAELASAWTGPVIAMGGSEDRESLALLAELLKPAGVDVEVIAEQGFARTFSALPRLRLAVGGDTGLLHLAGVSGVCVLGVFGPTTSADGFWCHEDGRVVEEDLGCRPCSRHGGELCPIGDHACMQSVSAQRVLEAAQALVGEEFWRVSAPEGVGLTVPDGVVQLGQGSD